MQRQVKARLLKVSLLLLLISIGAYLILSNMRNNIIFFIPPAELSSSSLDLHKVKIGGLVKTGSVTQEGNKTIFTLTDEKAEVIVSYQGIVPALFREQQGIIAEGKLALDQSGQYVLIADKLLTKHDENYRPPATIINKPVVD